MLSIDIKTILSGYSESLNVQGGKTPVQVRFCINSVLGISNVTLPLSCAWGLSSSVNYEYIRNCLSEYGTFTDQQIQNLIDCISNCRVGATVSSQEKGLIQWKDCCNNTYTETINNQTLTITGCVKTNSVQPFINAANPGITLSAVTYGATNCDCPPPSPTPTPTVTPTIGFTLTPTPTLTRTPTPTTTVTPTVSRSAKPLIPITLLPIPPTPSFNPTPTPTASPNIPTIGCGTQVGFTTSNAIIGPKTYIYKVNLGAQIGNVKLNIDFKACNDRAIVIYDGQTVIDTGCQGQYYEACYSDPQCSTGINAGEKLAPWNNPYIIASTVTNPNGQQSPGNIQENQNSGECNNKISFYKSGASPTFAYLIVKSPSPHTLNFNGTYVCDKTVWEGSLSCPDGDTFNFLGPNSLKLLTTQQQYNCLTGDTLTPMTIPVNTVLTILPSWGYPPGGGGLGDIKHTVWVEGASAVSNPAGVYAPANGSPNWVVTPNPQTVYDIIIPNPTLPPTTFNGTRFHLASNVNSGPWGIVLQCGPNAGNNGQLYGNSVVYWKPFSVKYATPGVYDITVKVWRQNSNNLNCGWYRYRNYITVV